jgi:hypothetical protein
VFARLLHWYRLLTEPSSASLVVISSSAYGWRVRDRFGECTPRMTYDRACLYVRSFGGRIERAS